MLRPVGTLELSSHFLEDRVDLITDSPLNHAKSTLTQSLGRVHGLNSGKVEQSNMTKCIIYSHLPASIRSSFVTTASVRPPSGSHSRAIFKLSLVAMSVFAVTTAKIILFGLLMYLSTKSRICTSMSTG